MWAEWRETTRAVVIPRYPGTVIVAMLPFLDLKRRMIRTSAVDQAPLRITAVKGGIYPAVTSKKGTRVSNALIPLCSSH